MAEVPELGQIRIIPDFMNYGIANGKTYTSAGNDGYEMFDHRTSSVYTDSGTGYDYHYLNTSMASGRDKMFIGYGTADNGYFITGTSTKITSGYTEVINSSGATGSVDFETTSDYCIATISSGSSPTGFSIYDSGNASASVIHIGEIFEMPTNATASLSYNTKYQNKVQTSFSGASYSTLYNKKSQRIIKASWEYINWSTGSSGIDDFTTMMNQCFGSHIPVALQLSQETPITAEHFIFCRITKWQQTQQSPNLWKVSAEFTEFI